MTLKQIYEIALIKGKDQGFKNTDLKGVCKCLIDSAHSMGIQIVNDRSEQDQTPDVAAAASWLNSSMRNCVEDSAWQNQFRLKFVPGETKVFSLRRKFGIEDMRITKVVIYRMAYF